MVPTKVRAACMTIISLRTTSSGAIATIDAHDLDGAETRRKNPIRAT